MRRFLHYTVKYYYRTKSPVRRTMSLRLVLDSSSELCHFTCKDKLLPSFLSTVVICGYCLLYLSNQSAKFFVDEHFLIPSDLNHTCVPLSLSVSLSFLWYDLLISSITEVNWRSRLYPSSWSWYVRKREREGEWWETRTICHYTYNV